MMTSFTQQRQLFLRQLTQTCPTTNSALKAYLTTCSELASPPYKKTRDPLAMKELSSKCPSCSHPYSSNSFHYRGKLPVNRRLHYLLAIRRKYQRIPSSGTYKRRLLDNFAAKSRSKLFIKCAHCLEVRTFQGATRKEIPMRTEPSLKPKPKPKPVSNNLRLKQTFENVFCRFLKKESNLRAFLEQL